MVTSDSSSDRERLEQRIKLLIPVEQTLRYLYEKVEVTPVDIDGWNYVNKPDFIVVSKASTSSAAETVTKLRKRFAEAVLFVETEDDSLENLQLILSYGANDILVDDESSDTFLRKAVLGVERVAPRQRGRLVVVDSGKGGVGATTTAIGMAASIAETGGSVALLDMDYESQDLTRYCAVRPFVNEVLDTLLSGRETLSLERVSQCSSRSLLDCDSEAGLASFDVIAPSQRYDGLLKGDVAVWSRFRDFLEILSSSYQVIVIDVGGLPAYVARKLYELSEDIVFLVDLNPLSVHSNLARLRSIISGRSDFFNVRLVCTCTSSLNLRRSDVHAEFARQIDLEGVPWSRALVPYDKRLRLWAGSGKNPLDVASGRYIAALTRLSEELDFTSEEIENRSRENPWKLEFFTKALGRYLPRRSENIPVLEKQNNVPMIEEFNGASPGTALVSGAKF